MVVLGEAGGLWAREAAPEAGTRIPATIVFGTLDARRIEIPGANWAGPRGDWATSDFTPLRQANAPRRPEAGPGPGIASAWPLLFAALLVSLAATALAATARRIHPRPDAGPRPRSRRTEAPENRVTRGDG